MGIAREAVARSPQSTKPATTTTLRPTARPIPTLRIGCDFRQALSLDTLELHHEREHWGKLRVRAQVRFEIGAPTGIPT